MIKVFGLFESAANTQNAVNHLVPSLVTESNLQLLGSDLAKQVVVTQRPRRAPLAQVGDHNVRVVESNQPPASQLRDLGLPAQKLPYFTKYVREGSVVLVVESEDDSAESVADVIRAANGTVS